MAEYIKKEESIKISESYGLKNGSTLGRHSGIADCIAEAISLIPSADVAPVRHGRWECGKPCPVCGRDRFEGLDADIWADWEPPYCPNCGAKMDGGTN